MVGNYRGSVNSQSPPTLRWVSVVIYVQVQPTQAKTIPHLNHKSWKGDLTDEIYLMVAHVPVGPFSKCHDFPHDDAEAPHVAGWSEFPVSDGLGGGPADGDFTSLTEEIN